MYVSQIVALAFKEFLALMRDKRSRLIIIVPPLLQMLIFGFAASYDLDNVPIAIFNQDVGGASRDYVSHFESSPNFDVKTYVHSDAQIEPLINNRDVLLVINIKADFSANLWQGKTAQVQTILDGRNSNTALIAMSYLGAVNEQFSRNWSRQHGLAGPDISLRVRSWYNENMLSRWFILPGIVGSLVMVVILLVIALSVAREREAGTFDQLLVTPMSPTQILIGKVIPGVVIGVIETSVILLIIAGLFHVPLRGELGALYFGLFLYLLSTTGVGLMISTISATQQQAVLGAFLFIVPAIILSGFAPPIANMPEAIQWLTYINPLRYFLIILRGVFLEGNGYEDLLSQYWPMAIIGVVSLVLAGWLFRQRTY
jgi:ABC-2 type transport system permease protein